METLYCTQIQMSGMLWNLANIFVIKYVEDHDKYSVQSSPIAAVLSHPAKPAAKCKEERNIYITVQNISP